MTSYSTSFKTPLVRLHYSNGLKAPRANDRGKEHYGCTLLIPKSTDLTAFANAISEAAIKEWGDKALTDLKNHVIKSPVLDGDGPQGRSKKTGEVKVGYPGHWFIRPSSGVTHPPALYNRQNMPADPTQIYCGVWGFAVLHGYSWGPNEQGRGVSFGIAAFQAVKDGDRLLGGGGAPPEKFFEPIADEGAAPAETTSGAGAAGLFGA